MSSSVINPFVTKFLDPIVSHEDKMLLLRYEYEDGNKGCIGVQTKALESLQAAIHRALENEKPVKRCSAVIEIIGARMRI